MLKFTKMHGIGNNYIYINNTGMQNIDFKVIRDFINLIRIKSIVLSVRDMLSKKLRLLFVVIVARSLKLMQET